MLVTAILDIGGVKMAKNHFMRRDTDNGHTYYFYPETEQEAKEFLKYMCSGKEYGVMRFSSEQPFPFSIGTSEDDWTLKFEEGGWGGLIQNRIYIKEKHKTEELFVIPVKLSEIWLKGVGNKNYCDYLSIEARDRSWSLDFKFSNETQYINLDTFFELEDKGRHGSYQFPK